MRLRAILPFILLIVFLFTSCKHEPESLVGTYDLSGIQYIGELTILEDDYFAFTAKYGHVNLVVYGTYEINQDTLDFQLLEKHKQPFTVYARKNSTIKDSLKFSNYKFKVPQDPLLMVNNNWYNLDSKNIAYDAATFVVPEKGVDSLALGIKERVSDTTAVATTVTMSTGALKDYTDFIINFNTYQKERLSFEQGATLVENGQLIYTGRRLAKKPITDTQREFLINYIKNDKFFPETIEANANTYYRINFKSVNEKKQLSKEDYTSLQGGAY